MEIEWKNPPTPPRGHRRWGPVVTKLQTRPGVWALVARDMSPSITAFLKTRGLEASARGVKNGRAAEIYARWPEESK